MRFIEILRVVALGWVVVSIAPPRAGAQSASLDPRWTPWLGCWQVDAAPRTTSAGSNAESSLTCVVPVAGSRNAQAVTVTGGKVVARKALEADGQARAMNESGCHGMRTGSWSADGRRLYWRADYSCDTGLHGVSTSIMSFANNGDWLQIEHVRAGRGSIEHVDRRRAVANLDGVPPEIAKPITARRLAIVTARADASAAAGNDEIAEALSTTDSTLVRHWLVERGQLAYAEPAPGRAVGMQPATTNVTVVQQPAPNGVMYCVSSGCYTENPYSTYNGVVVYPYANYPYLYPYPYGYSVFAPLIVSRGTTQHRGAEPFPRARGPVGVQPMSHVPPMRHEPTGERPVIHAPGTVGGGRRP